MCQQEQGSLTSVLVAELVMQTFMFAKAATQLQVLITADPIKTGILKLVHSRILPQALGISVSVLTQRFQE